METSRIESLRSLFGLHNYRLYRLDRDERAMLIHDILAQHRRLRREIDIPALRSLLRHQAWAEIDPDDILDGVEQLQFSSPYLNTYALLAALEPRFLNRFVRTLIKRESDPFRRRQPSGYKTFAGQHLGRPIHLAVLTRALPEKTATLMEALRTWQENAPMMPQIAPHFGLHRDYDEFLLGSALASLPPSPRSTVATSMGELI